MISKKTKFDITIIILCLIPLLIFFRLNKNNLIYYIHKKNKAVYYLIKALITILALVFMMYMKNLIFY